MQFEFFDFFLGGNLEREEKIIDFVKKEGFI